MEDSANKEKKVSEAPASESDAAKTTVNDNDQVTKSVEESDPSNSGQQRRRPTLKSLKIKAAGRKSKGSVAKSNPSNSTKRRKRKTLEFLKMKDPKKNSKGVETADDTADKILEKYKKRDQTEKLESVKGEPKIKRRKTVAFEPPPWNPSTKLSVEKLLGSRPSTDKSKRVSAHRLQRAKTSVGETSDEEKQPSHKNEKKQSNKNLSIDTKTEEEAEKTSEKEKQHEVQRLAKIRHKKRTKERRERNDQMPHDIFGYQSKLHLIKRADESPIVFELETKSELTAGERDMTWLSQLSKTKEKKVKHAGLSKTRQETFSWLFWRFISMGGRMPFQFVKKSNRKGESEITCEMKKTRINFCVFVLSTLFLLLLTVVSSFNLILIIVEKEVKGEPHNQLEKLLFEKNKMVALVFLTLLAQASISSIYILFYGDTMAKYMTNWRNTLDQFNFKASTGITAVIIIYILWFSTFLAAQVVVFYFSLFDSKPNAFIEGTHLLTTMVFRSFVKDVLIQIKEIPDGVSEIESSDQLWMYGIFIVCLNAYALYCSTNFVMMVVLYSIGIKNMAAEWNFRLRLILQQYRINESEHFLLNVNESLTYQKMFDWHRSIVRLVTEYSKVFYAILAPFYLATAFVLAGELFDLSIHIVGQEVLAFNLNESARLYDFENDSGHFMHLCFYMSQTIGVFLFVSLFLSQTGSEVMNGMITIARHSYMIIKSTHQRRFFMSLSMSFSAGKPHLLRVGKIVSIDKSFIIGFLAFFLYYFSVMIQTQHERILTLPIVLECPPGSGQFCVASRLVTEKDVGEINDLNDASSIKLQDQTMLRNLINWTSTSPNFSSTLPSSMTTTTTTSTPTMTTTTTTPTTTTTTTTPTTSTTTTTTTPPSRSPGLDSCDNPAPTPTSKQMAVQKNILGASYILCCYQPSCNRPSNALDTCNYIPNPSNSTIPPYHFSSLVFNLQSCFGVFAPLLCNKIDKDACFCGDPPTVIDVVDTFTGRTLLDCP